GVTPNGCCRRPKNFKNIGSVPLVMLNALLSGGGHVIPDPWFAPLLRRLDFNQEIWSGACCSTGSLTNRVSRRVDCPVRGARHISSSSPTMYFRHLFS